ncbi:MULTISPECIES: ABC transporter ATP-binding protein [Enterobacteriaceae]|uniref:ABC transporter ATP-binding protein n=1 Tax=Enterobacteriaceae TaxID=543 RepID=UPI0006992810|nr:ABC transporter ATP-binding protein [Escherichia coli]EFN8342440.1 ABC transporter ATP-binding protein [Escherichia coli]
MIDLTIHKKTFAERVLFSDVKIRVEAGDFIVFTGPSGAGKSTLLNILGMLDMNYSGDYHFQGKSIKSLTSSQVSMIRKKHLGYIFQDSLINERQTIKRNVLCAIDYPLHKQMHNKINSTLNRVGLNNSNILASFLSGGEKQRLALARALIKNPSILFADEPTANLDRKNKINVINILSDFNSRGGTVVMVTHDTQLIKPRMKVHLVE